MSAGFSFQDVLNAPDFGRLIPPNMLLNDVQFPKANAVHWFLQAGKNSWRKQQRLIHSSLKRSLSCRLNIRRGFSPWWCGWRRRTCDYEINDSGAGSNLLKRWTVAQ